FQNPRSWRRGISATGQVQGRQERVTSAGEVKRDAEKNVVRHFYRRVALCVERHLHELEGTQADDGGDGRTPPGFGGRRSGYFREEPGRIHYSGQSRQRVEPAAAGEGRSGGELQRKSGRLHA